MTYILALAIIGVIGTTTDPTPSPLNAVRFDQRLDAPLPLDAAFVDERGRQVQLRDYVGDRPVVLTLVQFRCSMLCTIVLDGLVKAMADVPLEAGRDFDVIILSLDPRETSEAAAKMKRELAARLPGKSITQGWHLLTGDDATIHRVADAIGYGYAYDARTDQYAHPGGLVLVTPDGRVSQYVLGAAFSPRTLRLGLVEASQGRIGTIVDQLLLRCFQYDPSTGRYTMTVMWVLRAAAVATVVGMAIGVVAMSRRHRRDHAPCQPAKDGA